MEDGGYDENTYRRRYSENAIKGCLRMGVHHLYMNSRQHYTMEGITIEIDENEIDAVLNALVDSVELSDLVDRILIAAVEKIDEED